METWRYMHQAKCLLRQGFGNEAFPLLEVPHRSIVN